LDEGEKATDAAAATKLMLFTHHVCMYEGRVGPIQRANS